VRGANRGGTICGGDSNGRMLARFHEVILLRAAYDAFIRALVVGLSFCFD
jgi:hypothetical protein